jgi:4-amino-4-deoxy-L-arabinose transferase-like glycosyltransferase
MQGLPSNGSPPAGSATSAAWRPDLACLIGLLLLAVGLRAWLLWNTEVAARDSIGFIRYALQFDGQSRPPFIKTWGDVIRGNHQHPGYPLTILAISYPVRFLLGGTTPAAMQLSAQLASGLAAVLLVIPMFYLGKTLYDRRVGFWAAVVFQCLPITAHILSDGLSESLFLLLATTSLLCAALAICGNSWLRFALCGACCGLTYLVRPEGGLLLAAAGLVLIGMQLAPRFRRHWSTWLACGMSLGLAATAVGSPYVLITGHLTNKPSVHIMVGDPPAEERKSENRRGAPDAEPEAAATLSRRPLFASILAVWLKPEGSLLQRLRVGLVAVVDELLRGYHYLAWMPALLGLCWFNDRTRTLPSFWVVHVTCALHFLVLWRLAVVVGYVSERHVQLLLLVGCYPAVAAMIAVPQWLAGWVSRRLESQARLRRRLLAASTSLLSLAMMVGLVAAGMPRTLQKLHANRAGYHAAGLWLAGQVIHPVDEVDDSHCWAHFYAGEVFDEGKPRIGPSCVTPVRYIVVGRHKDAEVAPANPEREPAVPPQGRLVYYWPPQKPAAAADVVVYAVPLPAAVAAPTP